MGGYLRIGDVAARSNVSIDTIRYYERRDLLPKAPRSDGGYRLFTSQSVDRVLFIKQAQELGFSLEEIAALLSAGETSDCRHVHDLLDGKLAELDRKLKAMQEFRTKLKSYLDECETELEKHPDSTACPVVIEIARGRN
ncbi:MAG: heavy metal-responsive transcriptional regulator [Acidobacteria bacterium]|nr:heavy metal-responsive transcriptional regulator [Acidobacteriota bacterium]